eukprot:5379143-Amphidinium_carterae.1
MYPPPAAMNVDTDFMVINFIYQKLQTNPLLLLCHTVCAVACTLIIGYQILTQVRAEAAELAEASWKLLIVLLYALWVFFIL